MLRGDLHVCLFNLHMVRMCNIGIFSSLSLSHTIEECLLISIKYWNKSRVRFSIYIPRHLNNYYTTLGSCTPSIYIYNINWNYNFFNYANDEESSQKANIIFGNLILANLSNNYTKSEYLRLFPSPFDSILCRKSEDP